MKETILALLGGGAVVQLINSLVTLRQNRRQMNASALGGEVEALEKTIAVLFSNIERQNETHRTETADLRAQIDTLRAEKRDLEHRVQVLTLQMKNLRKNPSAVQMTLDL